MNYGQLKEEVNAYEAAPRETRVAIKTTEDTLISVKEIIVEVNEDNEPVIVIVTE